MRDHGGNLDWAVARYGGVSDAWLDLSTGINPVAYPIPELPARAWTALPTQADMDRLRVAAQSCYGTTACVVPLAGAQAAIQLVPSLLPTGRAHVLGPTYNEHAAALRADGWDVREVAEVDALVGADLAVVVTPNNPDGRRVPPEALSGMAGRVGMLVVDESFIDETPEQSFAPHVDQTSNVIVLRSFGKFYGLAGLRLGFAIAPQELARKLEERAGPWPVSGAAISIGTTALADRGWAALTTERIRRDAAALDGIAARAGWSLVGGCCLFRTYDTGNAPAVQVRLAEAYIWSRIFPYSDSWIRLGCPASDADRVRVATAIGA